MALIAFLAGAVIAETLVSYYYPQDGEIEGASLALYRNGVFCPNGTAGNWGVCAKGTVQTVQNLTVVNTGNVNLTVSITTTGLPSDWLLEWQGNNTLLEPDWKVEAALSLTIPANATVWPEWAFSLNGDA